MDHLEIICAKTAATSTQKDRRLGQRRLINTSALLAAHQNLDSRKFPKDHPVARWKLRRVGSKHVTSSFQDEGALIDVQNYKKECNCGQVMQRGMTKEHK